ncbi:MAG: hypothetical protein JRN39_02970 [Nitrososphaerota archaeon]|nr:hypothetical protein [Nitrososphaerota archaeon]MDG6939344.1 hypothetical protein [Nitrososphaerota archaeon]
MKGIDARIIELWKDVYPASAYTAGWDEFAGRLFVPSESNVKKALREARALKARASTKLQRKVLGSIEADLLFEEPQPLIEGIVGAIFNHLTKEGVDEAHLRSLLSHASQALDAAGSRFERKKVPIGVRVLTMYRLDGIMDILDTVGKEAKGAELKGLCEEVKEKARKFVLSFGVEGFGKGRFEEVRDVFRKHGFDLGRQRSYRKALRESYDYHETPERLEKDALRWLDGELRLYRDVTKRLAEAYGCGPDAVEERLRTRVAIRPEDLKSTTDSIRQVIQRLVDKEVANINPRYDTRVIETPSYLTGVLPTAAAGFFDSFTDHPFQLYFITTDPDRDPIRSVASLINTLVHEEYGHCVHHSNSSVGYVEELNPLEELPTTFQGPVTEGLSFNRELEFLECVKRLEGKARLSEEERGYADAMERYGGLHLMNMEVEYETRKWRIVRFLRVIGDVRVNTGKQGLLEFVGWAHGYTGVPEASVYFQLFPAHEGMGPGYATCYAVVGEEIRELERRIGDDGRRVQFSTYLCSIGYPPRSIYREKLEAYLKKLQPAPGRPS